MTDETLLIDGLKDGVLRLTLNRPKKMNALATPLLSQIADAIDASNADDGVRCIVITGGDKVFAAGADINELKTRNAQDGLTDVRPALWARIRGANKPVVAAVEGFCLGAGNELLMCADIAIAGEGARFGQPETNLGIIPGAGGAALLPRLVGQQKAMRMVLLGEFLRADEALDCGLISEVVPAGDAISRAQELAIKIAKRAPLAMIQGKAVVRNALEGSLNAGLTYERQAFSMLLSTDDKTAGIDAFLNKDKPKWSGT